MSRFADTTSPNHRTTLIGPVYPYRGGISRFNSLLAGAFQAANRQIQIVSFLRQYPKWLYPGKSDRDFQQTQPPQDVYYGLDPLFPWTWVSTLAKIERFKPSLVIIQWWTTFWAPCFSFLAWSLRRKGIPVLFLIHNVLPHETRFFDPWLARLALSQGCSHLVLSPNTEKQLIELLPDSKPIRCVHPIYHPISTEIMGRDQARQHLQLPAGKNIILFFGIVRPYKGLTVLIQALSILLKTTDNVTLLIAGEFWDPIENYQRLITQLGLDSVVTIVDHYIPDDEVNLYFSAADIYCAPYTSATQSGSVKLAMGFRLPIIATEPAAADIPDGTYPNLIVVPPNNPVILASALHNQLDQPASVDGAIHSADWSDLVTVIENTAVMPS